MDTHVSMFTASDDERGAGAFSTETLRQVERSVEGAFNDPALYQRHWFRDYDGYRVKPPIHISHGELARVPRAYRHLFAADNTPETLNLAIQRAAKKAVPEPVKMALRRLRTSMGRER